MGLRRKAVLHIGPYKTGSTTIQSFLQMNADLLQQQGIHFAASPGRPNNVGLAVSCLDPHRITGLIKRLGLQFPEDRSQYIEQFRKALDREMRQLSSDIECVIFSNEHCSGLIMEHEIVRLKELLDPYFSSIDVVLYLRSQDSRIISDYTEKVKDGYTEYFDIFNYRPAEGLDYEVFLDKWASVFGVSAIKPRVFSREKFTNGDLVDDFCDAVDIVIGADFERPEVANTGLSHNAVAFLRHFNKHFPAYLKEKPNPVRSRLLPLIRRRFPGNGVEVNPASRRALLEQYQESNSRVAERYFNSAVNLFDKDFVSGDPHKEKDLSAEEAIEIAAHLWKEQAELINELKGEISRLKQRRSSEMFAWVDDLELLRTRANEILESDQNRELYYPSLLDELMKCHEELVAVRKIVASGGKKSGGDH
ncbi:MAG: hypothetical protein AAFX54_07795 [Pseudomonadota bacterium]